MRIIRKAIKYYTIKRAQNKLFKLKYYQKSKFDILSKYFNSIYNEIKGYDVSKFFTPTWEKINIELEKEFLPDFPI